MSSCVWETLGSILSGLCVALNDLRLSVCVCVFQQQTDSLSHQATDQYSAAKSDISVPVSKEHQTVG